MRQNGKQRGASAHTKRMKKLCGSAAALAAAGIAAKFIGAMHKLPLIAFLGAEGTGLYQLAFPVYAAVLMLTSGGTVQAVSREAAREGGRAADAFSAGLLFAVIAGVAGGMFMAAAGKTLAALQGNPEAFPSYLALAPAVPFSCVIAALRGWWQGRRSLLPTALGQLSEQVVKLVLGLALSHALMPFGTAFAVAGALAGVTAGELFTCAAMLVAARASLRREKERGRGTGFSVAFRRIACDALPTALGALVLPALQLTDSVMVVNILTSGGMSPSEATALYGVATAPASAIAGLPPMLTAAYAAALLPVLTGGSEEDKRRAASGATGVAFLAGIAGAAVMTVFPCEITDVLYPGGLNGERLDTAVFALRASGAGVAFVCLKQITSAALQAEGRAYIPALTMLAAGAVKAALTAVFVRAFGAGGGAAATSAAYALSFAADAFASRGTLRACAPVFTMLKCCLAVGTGAAAGIAARFLPVAGALPVAAVCGGVSLLAALLVLVASNAFGIASRLPSAAKIFSRIFANKIKKN